MATVSQVGIALSETRKRDNLVAQKSAPPFSSAIKLSRLEMVRRRVRAKECAERGRVVVENKFADMSAHQACEGLPTPVLSKFETLRRRIKIKEVAAMGARHATD